MADATHVYHIVGYPDTRPADFGYIEADSSQTALLYARTLEGFKTIDPEGGQDVEGTVTRITPAVSVTGATVQHRLNLRTGMEQLERDIGAALIKLQALRAELGWAPYKGPRP